MLLDFHPQVDDLRAWSAQLVWRERGRERSLVPDFFVRTASGATVVVLCPPAPPGRVAGSNGSWRWHGRSARWPGGSWLRRGCRGRWR
ncbi:hypothetical protein [Streptomyces reniochalinae]|uniref:hypothetical protein n=1 Tax=Streptomyces reniochalinae TaxID=2250578 RepID=UPI0011C02D89|nr:hypothetical protein [Streptomyces reniochalinae]